MSDVIRVYQFISDSLCNVAVLDAGVDNIMDTQAFNLSYLCDTSRNLSMKIHSANSTNYTVTVELSELQVQAFSFANSTTGAFDSCKHLFDHLSTNAIFMTHSISLPLRLGQEKFNMEYANALKACFTIPQSVGVIGGRPRHALWLIGCNGKIIV